MSEANERLQDARGSSHCSGTDDGQSMRSEAEIADRSGDDLLEKAVELCEELIGYVPDYFREHWKYDEQLEQICKAMKYRVTDGQ